MIIGDNAFNLIDFYKEQQIRIRTQRKRKRNKLFYKRDEYCFIQGEDYLPYSWHSRASLSFTGFAISAFYLTFQIFHNHVIYFLPSHSITRLLPVLALNKV